LAVYFQASVLLAVLLIATLLPPQVLPTRCACLRQLTERTDGCIGGYEGPWACQHTLLGMPRHNAAPLPPSLNGGCFTSLYAGPMRGGVWAGGLASHTSTREQKWVAGLSSRPAWYLTHVMPPAAVRLL
jgi:hypothetical protein